MGLLHERGMEGGRKVLLGRVVVLLRGREVGREGGRDVGTCVGA